MNLLTAAWECVTSVTVVNCFKKAGISSGTQEQSLNDDDDPFKLLAAQLDDFQDTCDENHRLILR